MRLSITRVSVLLIVVSLFLAIPAFSQDPTKVLIDKSKLTEQQLREIEGKSPDNLQKQVHDWAGVGHEIGTAVNESMAAVTTQANNFAQTPVGKLTAAVVIWKLVGSELVHLLFGVIFLIVFLPLWIWSYRKSCIDRTVLKSTTYDPVTKKTSKEYETVKYMNGRCDDFTPRIAHSMLIVLLLIVDLFIIFSF